MEKQEAIEIIKNHFPNNNTLLCEALKTLIPELKENEDEKIRKDLISYLKSDKEFIPSQSDTFYRRSIAWLEKQGEQKNVWNEDDDAILNAVIQDIQGRHPNAMWNIDTSKTAAVSTKYVIKWLKSLKQQNHLKSTEKED